MQPNLPTFRSDSAPVGLGFEHTDTRPHPSPHLAAERAERAPPGAAGNLWRRGGGSGGRSSAPAGRGDWRSRAHRARTRNVLTGGPSRRNLFLSASFVDIVLLLGYSF